MKKHRRILSLALALVMALALLPTAALAADSDFTIEYGFLTKYTGPGGAVTIPDSVTSIGINTFRECTSLVSITIPNSVTSIEKGAFRDCTGLTSITIPDSLTSIGEQAFSGCTGLTSITIPGNVTNIMNRAFAGCTGLTSVTIPRSVTNIDEAAFIGCTGLTSIEVAADNPNYTSQNGVLLNKDKTVLLQYPVTKTGAYIIPDGVTRIGESAFSSCTSLTSVTIPDSVTSIGNGAFYKCTGLTSVTVPGNVTNIESFAFYGCSNLTGVTIPGGVTSIGSYVFSGCNSLADIYYGGTEEQWRAIGWRSNDVFLSPTIHYNSSMPGQPAANTAYASTQTVNVDGKAVTFECYALKDANGNATNYIKLRDLALLLSGSPAQFQVGWDGAVTITTKTAYTPNGSELSTPYSGDRTYQETNAATKVNGQAADLAAFVLNDDQGGGYTYYQLRDLGKALGFNVGWAADKGIFVETDKPYDANN